MKILIVDDKPENLILLNTLLKGFGYQVEQASNGKEALDNLRKDAFQMIISDILMPEMDGYELCRICKSDTVLRNIIFVFYTATYTNEEDEKYARQLGADKFLIKPMEPAMFLSEISNIIKKALEEKIPKKEPQITDAEAIRMHRDRLLNKLGKKVDQLKSEIDERKKAEEEYRKLMEFNPEAIIVHSEDKIVYINRTGYKLLGADSSESFIGRRIFDFIHPDYHKIVRKRIQKLLAGDAYAPLTEEKFFNINGEAIDVEATTLPIIYDGKPVIQSLIRDITKRKQMEKTLKKIEHMLKVISENSRDIICLHDSKQIYVYISQACKPLLGYEPEKLVGTNPWDLVHPQDLEALQKEGLEKINKGKPSLLSYRIRKKSGDYIWFESTSQTIRDEKGNITGFVTSSRDITERKQAENLLREQEEFIRSIVEASRDWIWAIDKGGKHTYSNPAIENILGYKPDELMGKSNVYLLHEEDRKFVESQLPKWIDGKKGWEKLILRWSHRNGSWRWLESNSVPILNAQEEVIGFRGVDRDITERKQAEEDLRESRDRFKRIFDDSPIGMAISDTSYRFLKVNHSFSRMLGYTEKEILSLSFKDITHPDYLAKDIENIKKLASGEINIYRTEKQYIKKNGIVIWGYLTLSKILDEKMNLVFYLVMLQNITNRKQSEELIKINLREKEMLLQELYHRTKNNMQVISSMLRLRTRTIKEQHITAIFKEIENKILSMALVHQKLYESNDLSHLNLKEYIESLISLILQSYPESLALIKVKTNMNDIQVLIDTAVPMGLVINELLSNAFKHAFPNNRKGKIQINLNFIPENFLVLEFSDNGIGLPENFDIRTNKNLGMQMVFDLIESQLDGKVEVVNRDGLHYRLTLSRELYQPRI